MRPNLITRLKEEWNNLDPVDPLRGLIADAIDALAEQSATHGEQPRSDYRDWDYQDQLEEQAQPVVGNPPKNEQKTAETRMDTGFDGGGNLEQAQPVAHCEAGPEFCQQCSEESKPTYGSEEVRKLREVIESQARIIELMEREQGCPPFWPVVQYLLDEYGLQLIDIVAEYKKATEQAEQAQPFGYFKTEPFGWTDCAETEEGAIALYEAPSPHQQLTLEQLREHWQVARVLDMTDAEIVFADYVLIARDVEALHGIKGEA